MGPPLLPCEVSARRRRRQDSACRRLHPRKVRTKRQASACFRHELTGPSVPQRFWREKRPMCSGNCRLSVSVHTPGGERPLMVVQVTRLLATDVGREHTKRYDCLLFSPPFREGHRPARPLPGQCVPTESHAGRICEAVNLPGRAANSPPSECGGDWRDPADEKRHRAGTIGRRWSSASRQGGPKSG